MLLNIHIIYSIFGITQKYIRFKKPPEIQGAVRRYGSDKKDKVAPPKRRLKVHSNQHLFPTFIQYISSVDVQSKTKFTRKAGIICTIGPASRDIDTLTKMMDMGMDIARLNFSHGSHEYHKQSLENIRKAVEIRSDRLKRPCVLGIAMDTKGPEIRTGVMAKGLNFEEIIQKGSIVRLHTDKQFQNKGTASDLYIDYVKMPQLLEIGSSIYLDDGLIHLKVQEIDKSLITCIVVNGGVLGSNKGINIPGVDIDIPPISQKDKEDIDFGVKNGIDIIFASFIRAAEDIKEIKDLIGGNEILIVSKIENNQGIENIDEIIKASDGIMVARGDLGIEIPTERVFIAQKKLIASCNLAGKAVICATQMLESMTKKPRPTRAESSDVANAILDGADCVMLSGETAKGDYPVECVRVMADICRSAEGAVQHLQYFHEVSRLVPAPTDTTQSIAIAAVAAANKILATAILVITASGNSAFVVSKFRPPCNVYAITTNPAVARKCYMYRGLIPVIHTKKPLEDWAQHTEEKIKSGLKMGISLDHIHEGDRVILLTGWRKGVGNTSTMRIIRVTAEMISKLD